MATKETKAMLLTAGTAFLSAATGMLAAENYLAAVGLAAAGIAAFYVREVMKEEAVANGR